MNEFTYLQPTTLAEASRMLRNNEGATLSSGGTDLLGLLKHRIVTPDKVVNLKTVPGMTGITYKKGEGLSIGALAKITDIAVNDDVKKVYPVLAQAASQVASPQLRNMGTIGGNLCQRPRCWYYRGDFDCLKKGGAMCYAAEGENKYHAIVGGGPCYIVFPSDPAPALLSLDAELTIHNGSEERTVPLQDFYVLPEDSIEAENILQPGEIVTKIHVPEPQAGTKSAYTKFKEREVWNFAVVSVAMAARFEGGKIADISLGFGGVAPVPWKDDAINNALKGVATNEAALTEAIKKVFADAEPLEQNIFKIPLVRNIIKRMALDLSA